MFTGLIEDIGIVRAIEACNGGRTFTIEATGIMDDLHIGDSVAVQGACLTVVERDRHWFRVTAVEETLRKTTLGSFQVGTAVNLERAVLPTTRLGGHIVQGHVEAIGKIISITPLETSWEIWVECPRDGMRYVVPLGSIALDGISLTVARVQNDQFMVAIIPHTWSKTTLQFRRVGDSVNLEFDIVAKYVFHAVETIRGI